jgi:O-antigen/teichoic acid export membrane protein
MEITKHIVQNFIARACFTVSNFLLVLFFAHLLKAAGSGSLYYAINNYSVIVLIASLCLESGIIYFVARKEMDENEMASLAMFWAIVAGCLVSFIVVAIQRWHPVASNYYTFLYSFTLVAGTLITTFYSALYTARGQFLLPMLVPAIINFMLVCCFAWYFNANESASNISVITSLYFCSFLFCGILLASIYFLKYRVRLFKQWPTLQTTFRLLGYSLLALITNIVAFLALRIDYWVLKYFTPVAVSDSDLGNYIQVAKFIQIFLFMPTIVATVVFPSAASANSPRFHEAFSKSVGWILLFNILGCAGIIIAGKGIFPFLFGNSFSGMYVCFIFSVPAILAISVVRVLSAFFAGTNRVKYNLVGSLIALVVITTLNFLLVPHMGINGAALADSIGYLAFMLFLLLSSSRINKKIA